MPLPKSTVPIRRSFMRETVYTTLEKWIIEGVLTPGEILKDNELAESLGVSRTPVREALRRLEDKGLVESAANRWTRVSTVAVEEAERINPIIWTLEILALSQAIDNLDSHDLDMMAQENNNMQQALEQGDFVAASIADAHFHDVFIKKSGNPELIEILSDLKKKYRRIEIVYFHGCTTAMASIDEHNAIIQSLKEKDLKTALDMLKINWSDAKHLS